ALLLKPSVRWSRLRGASHKEAFASMPVGLFDIGTRGAEMPVWEWILIAACVFIVVAAVIVTASLVRSRRKTARMKQHYGREYERMVSETGDQKAAETELTARERKRDTLDIVP